jgi:mitofilin
VPAARPQWQRFYADPKNLDKTVLPPTTPSTTPSDVGSNTIPAAEVPLEPPTPETTGTTTAHTTSTSTQTSASRSAPAIPPTPTPPTGTGTARVAPDPVQPKPKKRRFFRRALLWLTILSALGYAGGVWYSLVSDNFHDFFTEYVPFAEDAVGYFEEREFRKRFPGRAGQPAIRAPLSDNQVVIPSNSGMAAKVADPEAAKHSPHLSAVEDNKASPSPKEQPAPKVGSNTPAAPAAPAAEEKKIVEGATETAKAEPKKEAAPAPAVKEAKEAPAKPITQVDHLSVPNASEPVVQDVVKIVNDIITVINADAGHGEKYNSTLEKAKSDLAKVVSDINLLKDSLKKDAEQEINAAHSQFDSAARELVQRLEVQMHEQETRWKEEYESEREKLSQTYKEKLQSELDIAKKVYEQRLKNELLEQSILLQKQFSSAVRDRVEAERDGRLGKLNELSSSVHELEQLTAEWNSVVDANLKTQHLVVAVEAVKSALETQVVPRPFTTELAALKEIAADDPVVSAAIASINPAAYQRGIPNAGQLIDRFRRVAQEVRKAALLPEDAGVASHLASLAMSKVLFKKSGLAVGQDVEAVLARTEVLLEEGDLDGAAREMNSLQGWAKVLSKDWLSDCRRVLEVKQALDVITTEARLQTLLVD